MTAAGERSLLVTVVKIEKTLIILKRPGKRRLTSWGKSVIDKDEDCFFWSKFDALPDHVNKLSNRKVGRNQISATQNEC
jgi:hypothetical protein